MKCKLIDSKEQNYKLENPIATSFYMDKYNEKELNDIITDLPKDIELFNHSFKLKNMKILLSNCKFFLKEIINGKNIITLISKNKNIFQMERKYVNDYCNFILDCL